MNKRHKELFEAQRLLKKLGFKFDQEKLTFNLGEHGRGRYHLLHTEFFDPTDEGWRDEREAGMKPGRWDACWTCKDGCHTLQELHNRCCGECGNQLHLEEGAELNPLECTTCFGLGPCEDCP